MLRIGNTIVEQNHFPDHSLLMKVTSEVINQQPIIVWNYENDAELFSLICLKKWFKDIPLDLYMPYCPHARQDRVKKIEDIFTLKYFCEIINSLDFKNVLIEDPHSNVCVALLNNVVVINAKQHIEKVIETIDNKDLIICYPDEGAVKRYSNLIEKPYTFGVKRRNWEDGSILGLDLINAEDIKEKDILIVDDICSKGGTFYHTAKALKEAGAGKVYLYVTHCEPTIFEGELLKENLIEHIYTTNSIFPSDLTNEKITIIE